MLYIDDNIYTKQYILNNYCTIAQCNQLFNQFVTSVYLNTYYRIVTKRSVNSVMNEKYLLEHLKHPYLVNMHFAF